MPQAADWLPAGAARTPALRAILAAALETWSARWLGAATLILTDVETIEADACAAPLDGGWTIHHDKVAIAASRPQVRRLAGMAVQAPVEALVLSEADADLLDAFAERMLTDLSASLELAFGGAAGENGPPRRVIDPFGTQGGLLASAAIGCGEPLVQFALPMGLWAGALRTSLALGRRPAVPLPPVSPVVAETRIAVEALLGRAVLRLGEVVALAPGDLIVLDSSVEGGAELLLAGSGRPLARGTLTAAADRLALALHSKQARKDPQDAEAAA
jgi:hypothetical protein